MCYTNFSIIWGVNMDEEITKEKNKKITRLSGVELLKIIAIFIICLAHAVQTSSQFVDYTNLNFETMVFKIFIYFGQIGNILFIICSSWFLFNGKGTNKSKAIKILLDSMFISIIIMVIFIIIGQKFTIYEIVRQVLPDIFGNMWFIPIYVVFYLIHPLLNKLINLMNKTQHFVCCLIMFCFFALLDICFGWSFIVNRLLSFIIVFFIVAYMKRYHGDFYKKRKLNLILFLILFSIFVVVVLLKSTCIVSGLVIDSWCLAITLPALLFLFNVFYSLPIKSRTINYLSSCSLFVYCIHENMLLRNILRPQYYDYVLSISPDMYFWWTMLCGVGMFVGAYLISLLYSVTLSKLTNKISLVFSNILDKFFSLFKKSSKK